MTAPTTTAPAAEISAWSELIVITITHAPPFDLPTSCFGGSGPMPPPGEQFTAAHMTPHAFTVGRIEIEIGESEIIGYAAFPAGSTIVWRGIHDHCESNRDVGNGGVHRKHWPAWLTDLVDQTMSKADPRAQLPEKCPNCDSVELSWTVAPARTRAGAGDGRLRASEVTALFALGCDGCSETVATLSADEVAAAMNIAHKPLLGD